MSGRAWAGAALAALVLLTGCTTAPPTPPPQGLNAPMGPGTRHDARALILVTMRNPDHAALTGGIDVSASPLPAPYAALLEQWETRYGLKRVADWALRSLPVRCMVFEVAAGRVRENVMRELAQAPLVETVQALQEFNVLSEPVPPRSLRSLPPEGAGPPGERPVLSPVEGPGGGPAAQPTYNDPYAKLQHGFEQMGVAASHRWATGRGVRVAVIDTGMDSNHPELRGRVVLRRNLVDGDLERFDADVHGTAVAAVIGAAANNAEGLVGVAPEVSFVALKACWHDRPDYAGAACNSFTLAKALDVASAQQVDVINLSLGGPADPLLSRLVARAQAQDIVVVGSVDRRYPQGFPAATAGVIAADSDTRTRNGGDDAGASANALRAPADKIVSARPAGQYDLYSGSSVAAAQITGVVALVRQRKPHLPAAAMGALLTSTADPQTGSVNACRALARVMVQDEAGCR
jgi:Subtilase family